MAESSPEAPPSRIKGFLVALASAILAFVGAQQLIELFDWSSNFIVFMAVFIAIDAALMLILNKLAGR